MKKGIILLFLCLLNLNATEFEYGNGNFNIDFGLLGLNKNHTEKIQIFSILQRHKNIFSSNWFYSYRISWFKSKTIKTLVNYYNSNANSVNNINKLLSDYSNNSTTDSNNTSNNSTASDVNSSQIPTLINLSNKIRGLDINFVFGRDLLNSSLQDTYLGIGVLAGLTIPYIKSSSSDSNYLKESKTKIITYKIGGIIKGGYLLNPILQVYGDMAYSYQTGRIKNDELGINSKSSGDNFIFDVGAKLQLKTTKQIGFIKLTPALFLTFGYRYDYWKVNSIKINSQNLMSKNTNLNFTISQVYFGLGYDF